MLNWVISTGLEYVVESYHVAHDVDIWVGYAITNASLSCEIYHNLGLLLLEDAIDGSFVGNIALDEMVLT